MAGPWDQFKTAAPSPSGAKPWEKFAAQPEAVQERIDPTEGDSFLTNTLAGVGGAFADLGLRGRQAYATVADALAGGNRSAGVEREIADKRQLDAPLQERAGGKVGNFVGKALPATLAALVPGGQGLAGSIAIGGASGALEPTVGNESTLGNVLGGAAGGAAGYGLARGAGALLNRAAASGSAAQQLNSVRDRVAQSARESGYVIPPVQTNPTLLNRTLEGLAGKISTAQGASGKNQAITNSKVANALGLDPMKPITRDSLNALRAEAGKAYQAVSGIGEVVPDQSYAKALDDIVAPYAKAAESFPNDRLNPIIAEIETLRTPSFDAASAVAKIRNLRADADKAYAGGDKELGKALRSGAGALEDAIEGQLQRSQGGDALLQTFRGARQLIAKTYTVEKALNESTGNVAARKLAQQLAKGKPLSGELKQVAQFAQAFPKAADEITSSMPGVSPLDFYGAGGLSAITGNPAALAAIAVRPGARSGILSSAGQRVLGTQSYDPSLALRLLGDQRLRAPSVGAGTAVADLLREKERQNQGR